MSQTQPASIGYVTVSATFGVTQYQQYSYLFWQQIITMVLLGGLYGACMRDKTIVQVTEVL